MYVSVVSLFISKILGGVFTCMSVWYLCSSLSFGVESSHACQCGIFVHL